MRIFEIANTYKQDLAANKIAFYQFNTNDAKIKNIIDTKCSDIKNQYIQNPDHYIYKGTKRSQFAFFGDTLKWQRKSANTINLFNSLIDILPSWQDYPKRSQSLICSTSFSYASSYGNPFVIFPYNDATIAIGKSDDFFNNFYFDEISGTYSTIRYALEKISGGRINENDFRGHISPEKLNELDSYIKNHWNTLEQWASEKPESYLQSAYSKKVLKIMKSMENFDRSLIQWSNHILSPANNDMKLSNSSNFENIWDINREVWFSGRFVAIPCHDFDKTYSKWKFDQEYWLS